MKNKLLIGIVMFMIVCSGIVMSDDSGNLEEGDVFRFREKGLLYRVNDQGDVETYSERENTWKDSTVYSFDNGKITYSDGNGEQDIIIDENPSELGSEEEDSTTQNTEDNGNGENTEDNGNGQNTEEEEETIPQLSISGNYQDGSGNPVEITEKGFKDTGGNSVEIVYEPLDNNDNILREVGFNNGEPVYTGQYKIEGTNGNSLEIDSERYDDLTSGGDIGSLYNIEVDNNNNIKITDNNNNLIARQTQDGGGTTTTIPQEDGGEKTITRGENYYEIEIQDSNGNTIDLFRIGDLDDDNEGNERQEAINIEGTDFDILTTDAETGEPLRIEISIPDDDDIFIDFTGDEPEFSTDGKNWFNADSNEYDDLTEAQKDAVESNDGLHRSWSSKRFFSSLFSSYTRFQGLFSNSKLFKPIEPAPIFENAADWIAGNLGVDPIISDICGQYPDYESDTENIVFIDTPSNLLNTGAHVEGKILSEIELLNGSTEYTYLVSGYINNAGNESVKIQISLRRGNQFKPLIFDTDTNATEITVESGSILSWTESSETNNILQARSHDINYNEVCMVFLQKGAFDDFSDLSGDKFCSDIQT